jgi:pimeloyl-ACP methyl ester carboxylesterase
MGETISKLVFRPPSPATRIKPENFFYLELSSPSDFIGCASSYACVSSQGFDGECDVAADDGPYRIPAFFLLNRGAKLTVLYSHGNAEDLGMMYRRMKEIAKALGVNVMAYDYPGYGLSTPQCKPTEKLCYQAIETSYSYLVNVMKIPYSNIVLYGRSLGTGPSCYLANKTSLEGKPVGGIILHSPYLSIYRIVVDSNALGMIGDMFQSYKRAKDIRCPVLVIHGYEDKVVPFWHGDELLRTFPPEFRAKPFFVERMGHNNIESRCRDEYVSQITAFLQNYVTGNPMPIPEHERYIPSSDLQDSGKSKLNQTWVDHGVSIVNNAVKNNGLNRLRPENYNNSQNNSQSHHQHPIYSHENTRDIIQELNARIDDDGRLDLSHFLDTQESWVTETGDFSDNQSENEGIKLQNLDRSGIVSYSLSED